MKIQHISPQIINSKNNNKEDVRFTGLADGAAIAGSTALRFFDVNQAIGANTMDLCTMVLPRTIYDFNNRGPLAGIETGRRESAGTFNHAMVGVYGTVAGAALAYTLRDKFGFNLNHIFADNNTIDILSNIHHTSVHNNSADPLRESLNKIAESITVRNSEADVETGWVGLNNETKNKFVDKLYDILKNKNIKKLDKESKEYIYSIVTASTGGEKSVKLSGFGKEAESSLNNMISNIYNVMKSFDSEKVNKIFENAKDLKANEFVNSLKKFNKTRAAAGLGFATLFGVSVQPLNMYLTKKKTGQDGFVGVPGREKDNSAGFKMQKILAGLAFAAAAISTITTNPKHLLSKVQFQGMLPTINQLKMVYGITIASRLMSARDKDELRESAVKDTLGFMSLLVLGSLITKGTAKLLDKSGSLINMAKNDGQGFFRWMTNSSLKTRDEVLYSALKKHGISTVKDGKALKFSELMKLLPKDDKLTRVKLRNLNIAQLVGYAYSAVVLGFGIPKLNDYMTKKNEAKRLAKLAAQNNNQQQASTITNDTAQTAAAKSQNFTANSIVEKNKFLGA
ncbi:TPA: hypothetical protein IAC10_11695 [Candidatus Scatousia excrementigallinarum]|uniref:Uncharacterized protein n=1 Tax=Candidatus Scatousia excrementigallinarum TaxID=2840935 RepID=A0A9D1F0N4_9BACT|nr:hypothetical protein [Candidatus Scatousia excrementigallinarum]